MTALLAYDVFGKSEDEILYNREKFAKEGRYELYEARYLARKEGGEN